MGRLWPERVRVHSRWLASSIQATPSNPHIASSPYFSPNLVAEFPLRMINRTTGQPMLHARLGNETTPGDVAAVVLEWTLLSRFTGACFGGKVCG